MPDAVFLTSRKYLLEMQTFIVGKTQNRIREFCSEYKINPTLHSLPESCDGIQSPSPPATPVPTSSTKPSPISSTPSPPVSPATSPVRRHSPSPASTTCPCLGSQDARLAPWSPSAAPCHHILEHRCVLQHVWGEKWREMTPLRLGWIPYLVGSGIWSSSPWCRCSPAEPPYHPCRWQWPRPSGSSYYPRPRSTCHGRPGPWMIDIWMVSNEEKYLARSGLNRDDVAFGLVQNLRVA